MRKRRWSVLMLGVLLAGMHSACAKEEKTAQLTPGSSSENAPVQMSGAGTTPAVLTAAIYPDKPTADKQLIAHYEGKGEKDEVTQYTFRWYVDNELVQEGPLGTLGPGKYRKKSEVYLEIIPSNSRGVGKAFRTGTVTIGNLAPTVTALALAPQNPPVGTTITATPTGADPDGDAITYAYQWFVNDKPAAAQQGGNTFNTGGLKKKDMVAVVVTPSDGEIAGLPRTADVVALSNNAPQITSTPPTLQQDGMYIYPVLAKDVDGDTLTYGLVKSPPGMAIDRSTGLIRWEVPKQVAGKQDVAVRISVDDGDGGTGFQEFSLVLEPR